MKTPLRPTRRRVLVSLGLACVVAVLSGCSKAPAEERLRERFEAMRTAMLERKPGEFMDGVAEDFTGGPNLDRAALHNYLRAQLLRNAEIGATVGPLDIAIDGERATMQFTMVLTGGAGGLIPERANGWAVKTGWRDGDAGWQLYFAQWEPAL